MSSNIQKIFTSRKQIPTGVDYIGSINRLWYDHDSNSLRTSDGVTPGGLSVLSTPISTDADNLLTVGTDGGYFSTTSPLISAVVVAIASDIEDLSARVTLLDAVIVGDDDQILRANQVIREATTLIQTQHILIEGMIT